MHCLFAALLILIVWSQAAMAQQDKKTDDLKPADLDAGESTVEETTVGLLPNPFEKQGVKFAVTYIGEVLANPTGGIKRAAIYEDRINFAADIDFEKLLGIKQLTFHTNVFQLDADSLSRKIRRRWTSARGSKRFSTGAGIPSMPGTIVLASDGSSSPAVVMRPMSQFQQPSDPRGSPGSKWSPKRRTSLRRDAQADCLLSPLRAGRPSP